MILQDRAVVLDSTLQEAILGIEKMAYDFYTPQPIKSPPPYSLPAHLPPHSLTTTDAHIYYLRRILHNYQDGVCISILSNIAAAMGPTSRLLIAELIVPARTAVGEDMDAYLMDMVMISIGGKERDESGFGNLLGQVGLEAVRVWRAEVGQQSVIEARLKRG